MIALLLKTEQGSRGVLNSITCCIAAVGSRQRTKAAADACTPAQSRSDGRLLIIRCVTWCIVASQGLNERTNTPTQECSASTLSQGTTCHEFPTRTNGIIQTLGHLCFTEGGLAVTVTLRDGVFELTIQFVQTDSTFDEVTGEVDMGNFIHRSGYAGS